MNDYPATPRLTHHARKRCTEMGISTKVAKDIARNPSTTYAGSPEHGNDAKVAYSNLHTDYAIVFKIEDGVPVILTVLLHTNEQYVRPEKVRN